MLSHLSGLQEQNTWKASLELRFESNGRGKTVLAHNRHEGPLMVQKALYPEGPEVCHVMLLHPPSGIAGGDILDTQTRLEANSHALLSTPGATRWYKANTNTAIQHITFRLADQATLEWLPQENIFFEETNAINITRIFLQANSTVIGWDIVQLGSINHQDYWSHGKASLGTEIYLNEKLLWIEHGLIESSGFLRSAISGLDHFPVMASLWAYGTEIQHKHYETICESMVWNKEIRSGLSQLPQDNGKSLYLARYLGLHTETVRQHLIALWRQLRPYLTAFEFRPLRIWQT